MNVKNIIILGPPGSGKGTQAKKLAQELGLIYFGTGDLMREEAEKNTPIGQEFKKVWERGQGELVKENLVQQFVGQKIEEINISKGIVFDGYPRTVPQAKHLEEILSKEGVGDIKVLNLKVSVWSLVKRMQTRRICEKCDKIFQNPNANGKTFCDVCGGSLIQRAEDKPEVLTKRIEVYEKQTAPLVEYYGKQGKLINIDGEPPIKKVWEEIEEKIRSTPLGMQF